MAQHAYFVNSQHAYFVHVSHTRTCDQRRRVPPFSQVRTVALPAVAMPIAAHTTDKAVKVIEPMPHIGVACRAG